MVGVENSVNAQRSLDYCKEKYQLAPKIVTVDMSPSLIEAVGIVFGEEVIQIDGYHVMQELNKGIRRDVLDLRTHLFTDAIQELLQLRSGITQIQADIKRAGLCPKAAIKAILGPMPHHEVSRECFVFSRKILRLITIEDLENFQQHLEKVVTACLRKQHVLYQSFGQTLKNKLPKRQFTLKGMMRFKILLLQRLKTFILSFRSILEEKSSAFFKKQWLLYFQPEQLTPARKQQLDDFLLQYPEISEYRQLTLQMGEIYRLSPEEVDGHQIDNLVCKDHYSSKLQTVITTIKKFKSSILRFTTVFRDHPELPKAARANMEYLNPRVKAPFEAGRNCTGQILLFSKLQLQLNCEIRFFNDGEVVA